ncbi:uncharacterized protein B0I36DRAFT_225623, partial [Microdochium trichocladiopsis]
DEIKISGLIAMFDWILSRCEQTARETSRTVLCWFRSLQPDKIYPKPFTLVSAKASRQKYLRTFQRFVAFIFRIYRLPTFQRRELLPIRFDSDQQQLLRDIWSHEAWSEEQLLRNSYSLWNKENEDGEDDEDDEDEDDEDDDDEDDDDYKSSFLDEHFSDSGLSDSQSETEEKVQYANIKNQAIVPSPALSQLLELLFKLCITFYTEDFADGHPSSTYLVYFSGILGINPDGRGFRTARLYTPSLSALIYL